MNFYRFYGPGSTRGLAEVEDKRFEGGRSCPLDPHHRFLGHRISYELLLTRRPVPDVVWAWTAECFIQDHVLRWFREMGFTGYEVREVPAVRFKVRAKERDWCDDNPGLRREDAESEQIPKLWEFVVTGWGGVAPEESGIRLVDKCPGCGGREYTSETDATKLVDWSQWDGSDFFRVYPKTNYLWVTEQTARVLRKRKLKGVRLVSPAELNARPIRPDYCSGSPLKYWMPDEKARAIGIPLGIYG